MPRLAQVLDRVVQAGLGHADGGSPQVAAARRGVDGGDGGALAGRVGGGGWGVVGGGGGVREVGATGGAHRGGPTPRPPLAPTSSPRSSSHSSRRAATSSAEAARILATTDRKPSAFRWASRRSMSSCTTSSRAGEATRAARLATRMPWDCMTVPPSSCFRLFSRRVTPVDTRSRMTSALPISGAASRAPSAPSRRTLVKPLASKKERAMFW